MAALVLGLLALLASLADVGGFLGPLPAAVLLLLATSYVMARAIVNLAIFINARPRLRGVIVDVSGYTGDPVAITENASYVFRNEEWVRVGIDEAQRLWGGEAP